MFRMAMLTTATIAVATWLALIGGVAAPYQWWALAGIGAATIASLAYGWHIAQCVIKPLEGAAKIARQVAAGNLQIDIDTDQQGEVGNLRSEEQTSEIQSLMRISYDVFCLKQNKFISNI